MAKSTSERLLLLVVCLALPPGPSEQQPVFRSTVSTVAIYASVRDREGRLVTDLVREDFELLDNEKPVEITLFANEPVPITAALMFDTSSSITDQVDKLFSATADFIAALGPADRLRIGSFADEVSISPLLTGDKRVLARILNEEIWPGFGTALWRGLDTAVTSLADERGRRVVIAITDGYDSPTPGGVPPLKGGAGAIRGRAAEDRDLMIYGVWLRRNANDRGLSGEMKELSRLTGGGYLNLEPGADVRSAMTRLAEELRHQYALGFTPTVMDGKQHQLKIRVKRPGLVPRARLTYLAADKRP